MNIHRPTNAGSFPLFLFKLSPQVKCYVPFYNSCLFQTRNNSCHVIKKHLIGHCGSQNTSAVHSVKFSTMENIEFQLLESNYQVLSSLKYKHIHIFLILLYLSPGLNSVPLAKSHCLNGRCLAKSHCLNGRCLQISFIYFSKVSAIRLLNSKKKD